jgi:hypothetical protein
MQRAIVTMLLALAALVAPAAGLAGGSSHGRESMPVAARGESRGCCGDRCTCAIDCPCASKSDPAEPMQDAPAPQQTRDLRTVIVALPTRCAPTPTLPEVDAAFTATERRAGPSLHAGRMLLAFVSRWTT